jgi:hypothetical protein
MEAFTFEHRPSRLAYANKHVLIALIAVLLVATLVAHVPGILTTS